MLLPREELEKMGVMNPEIADYLAKNPRPPIDFTDHEKMRLGMKMMDDALNYGLPPAPPGTEFYHEIAMRDGFMSSLKVHKPSDGPPGPLIVLCFGGGFIGGTNDQLTKTARILMRLFGATVVNIAYRLAPEYPFPYGQHDAWDSMKWIADNAKGSILNSDPRKGFLMGGVSAGGAITASFSRLFQEDPIAFPLTGQWLSVPSIMEPTRVPENYKRYHISSEQLAQGAFLSREVRVWMRKLTKWDISSPLRFAIESKTDIAKQPPTYFQVDGADPLRDDALIYDEMLKEAGVATKIDLYPGCPHGHFAGFPGLEITNKANIDTIVGFGWLLGKKVSREDAAKELGL